MLTWKAAGVRPGAFEVDHHLDSVMLSSSPSLPRQARVDPHMGLVRSILGNPLSSLQKVDAAPERGAPAAAGQWVGERQRSV